MATASAPARTASGAALPWPTAATSHPLSSCAAGVVVSGFALQPAAQLKVEQPPMQLVEQDAHPALEQEEQLVTQE